MCESPVTFEPIPYVEEPCMFLKPVPGFYGYFVYKDGTAWSAKVKGGQGSLDFSNIHEMKYKYDKDGYKELCFSKKNPTKRYYRRLHRCVYEAYNGSITP